MAMSMGRVGSGQSSRMTGSSMGQRPRPGQGGGLQGGGAATASAAGFNTFT